MSGDEGAHALTLRLPSEQYERVRVEAFERRVPISEVIREAINDHIAERIANGPDFREDSRFALGGGPTCDACGKPSTYVSTPGGIRLCDDHRPKETR